MKAAKKETIMSDVKNHHSIDISALQRSQQALRIENEKPFVAVNDCTFITVEKEALKGSVKIWYPLRKKVTAFIGPSGCGKSTLLRWFYIMNDFVDGCRIYGWNQFLRDQNI